MSSLTNPLNPIKPERWVLTVREVAELLGVTERHIWQLQASGRFPTPIRLGRSTRWRRDELLAWLNAGCPSRDKWDAQEKGGA